MFGRNQPSHKINTNASKNRGLHFLIFSIKIYSERRPHATMKLLNMRRGYMCIYTTEIKREMPARGNTN